MTRLLRGIAEGLNGPAPARPPAAVPLVRDPVCGTFVVPARALASGTGAGTRFFCSEKCRRTYLSRDWNTASGDARPGEGVPNTKMAR